MLAGEDNNSQYRLETEILNGNGQMGVTTHGGSYRAGIDFSTNTVTLYKGDAAVATKVWKFTDKTTLVITVNDKKVSVWVDNSKMMDYIDTSSTILKGKFGIWAENSTGCFDSVVAYLVERADELPGDYAYELPPEPLSSAPAVADATYYVSLDGNDDWTGECDRLNAEGTGPFATIEAAAAAAAENSGHTTVLIRGGTYYLENKVVLNNSNITFAAYPGETPVISGGREVTSEWTEYKNGIWKTKLPESFRNVEIRQMFVENARATRSREPDVGENDHKVGAWTVNSVANDYMSIVPNGDIPKSWEGLTDVEMNSCGIWHYNRQTVKSFDADTNTVNSNIFIGVQCSGMKISPLGTNTSWTGQDDWLYFENALIFVDTQGEWFYDKNTNEMYYYPIDNANPNQQKFVIPVLETLVEVTGTKSEPVEKVDFYGVTFAHTTWSLNPMGSTFERRGIQGGFWGNEWSRAGQKDPVYAPTAAVIYTYAQCSRIQNCLFTHTGEGGIAFGAGSDSNLIYGCEFDDVGANCIQVGWRNSYTGVGHPLEREWDDPTDAPQGNQIVENYIHDCCTTDLGSVGIWTGFSNHNIIERNTIKNMPYTGISVGWRWSGEKEGSDCIPSDKNYSPAYNLTSSHNNTIKDNYIYNTMTAAADGGGIYVVGNQWNNKIIGNYVEKTDGNGIYLDEQTRYTETAYNYVKEHKLACIAEQKGINGNNIYDNVDLDVEGAPEAPDANDYGASINVGPMTKAK